MTWTWNESNLSTNLAKVRATIGDTNTDDRLLSDEHINEWLDKYSDDVILASARCVRDIIAKLSRQFDRTAVAFSGSRSQMVNHYRDLYADLVAERAGIAEMFVGGLSVDAEASMDSDGDYKGARIRIGMDDIAGNPTKKSEAE